MGKPIETWSLKYGTFYGDKAIPDGNTPECLADSPHTPHYKCTRTKGHTGAHVAMGGYDFVCARWIDRKVA